MTESLFTPATTALVLIDLQHSNVERTLAPYPASQVVANGTLLADRLRAAGGTIVHVRVLVHDLLRLPADKPVGRDTSAPPLPPAASELVADVPKHETDVFVTKRQWGAFHGTDLDLQLRRRGIRTLILAGIATNFGVESTARAALDIGYALVFADDAMSGISSALHTFATTELFPIMGRVRTTADIVAALGG
ncbi:nicotinamidase-related amidase [Pseudoduganella flava]|uniref:Isochorismatase family protein n=1 Tax=Pseudoduganella flava TaxID=871742 RepID=A0A562PEA6_9BURK|nr:isochorismatase family protein [Pseudoduganella flava]QGZ38771.1 isochorismatase family protein [Pseudoduganella flava]TWI42822.1 nicotinamidase-related amidase [Pseudoduganella flava]